MIIGSGINRMVMPAKVDKTDFILKDKFYQYYTARHFKYIFRLLKKVFLNSSYTHTHAKSVMYLSETVCTA